LQRFIPTLNVNEVIRFLSPPPDRRPKARLVTTLRQEDLDVLLSAGNDESHRARDLLSRATQVVYDSSDSRSLPDPEPESRSPDATAEPDEFTPLPRRTGLIGLFVPWLAPAAAAIWILLLWITNHGLTVPPTLAAQEQSVAASLPPCQVAAPARGDDAHYWILPVEAGSCPGSDFVRVYAIDHGHLEQAATAAPTDPKQVWWFRCADPSLCAFPAGGSRRIAVGEFVDPAHHALPLVLYRRDGTIYMLAPYLGPFRAASASKAVLHLTGSATAGWRPGQCGVSSALCGYPATYIAAVALNDRPGRVLLVVGYAVGHWYAPRAVITQAFSLSFQHGRVVFNPAPCGRNGRALTITLKTHLSGDPRSAMIAAWRRQQFLSPVTC
jgi:hypothetical protein